MSDGGKTLVLPQQMHVYQETTSVGPVLLSDSVSHIVTPSNGEQETAFFNLKDKGVFIY